MQNLSSTTENQKSVDNQLRAGTLMIAPESQVQL